MDPMLIEDVWHMRALVHDVALQLAIVEACSQGDPALPAGVELRRAVASCSTAGRDLRALADALQAAIVPPQCARCADSGCERC